jgi:hypothetical protein
MRDGKLSIAIEYSPPRRAFDFFIWVDARDGLRKFADQFVYLDSPEGTMIDPTLSVEPDVAQQIMDDLWRAGVRPTNIRKDDLALSAKDDHIKDLQKVAFTLLDAFNRGEE